MKFQLLVSLMFEQYLLMIQVVYRVDEGKRTTVATSSFTAYGDTGLGVMEYSDVSRTGLLFKLTATLPRNTLFATHGAFECSW